MSYVIRTLVVILSVLLVSPTLTLGANAKGTSAAGQTKSSPRAYTYITNIADGSYVAENFTVKLNLRAMTLTRQIGRAHV